MQEIPLDARVPAAGTRAENAVFVVQDDLVLEDEAGVRRAIGEHRVPRLEGRIVGDPDVTRAVQQLEEPPRSPSTADVGEEVALDRDAAGLLARMVVVAPEDVDAGAGVANDLRAKVRPRRPTTGLRPGSARSEIATRSGIRQFVLERLPSRSRGGRS